MLALRAAILAVGPCGDTKAAPGRHEADSSCRCSVSSPAFQVWANAEITSAAVMLPSLIPRGVPARLDPLPDQSPGYRCSAVQRRAGCLWGDVLVDVEEVAGIVGPLDLDQTVVVLPVVVPDLVVVVVLHEVDVAAWL